jgi:CxxC motif-containing protein (DUF1111 family)
MWSKIRSHFCPCIIRYRQLAWLVACMALAFAAGVARAAAPGDDLAQRVIAQGKDLFTREWLPGDPGRQSGDGLGPMYNDTA